MPEPGSKKQDVDRSHRHQDAEHGGVDDRHAEEAARRQPRRDPRDPFTEHGGQGGLADQRPETD